MKHLRPILTAAVALLAIGLVLGLTVLSASPDLHERIHGHDRKAPTNQQDSPAAPKVAGDDDGCAVVLFGQGVVLALALLATARRPSPLRAAGTALFDRLAPEESHYLHLPTQAPPAVLG